MKKYAIPDLDDPDFGPVFSRISSRMIGTTPIDEDDLDAWSLPALRDERRERLPKVIEAAHASDDEAQPEITLGLILHGHSECNDTVTQRGNDCHIECRHLR